MSARARVNNKTPHRRRNSRIGLIRLACCAIPLGVAVWPAALWASDSGILSQIGVTQLQGLNLNINGAGVAVAQVEAGGSNFEVNPAMVSQSASGFLTYINSTGDLSTSYSSGNVSEHANIVGNLFYGGGGYGVAPGVSAVYNYEADNFLNHIVGGYGSYTPTVPANIVANPMANPVTHASNGDAPQIPAKVVNQSFILIPSNGQPVPETTFNIQYDNYTDIYGTIFVSAVGDDSYTGTFPNSQINPPATAYNSIAVGAYQGQTGVGLTADGRSKPDIVAPGSETSFTTPLVSGAAALLVQAGVRGDGYSASNGMTQAAYEAAATDERTVKALLMNGAVKPSDWSNSSTQPLDTRYGAGVLNVFNSYEQLAAGREGPSAINSNNSMKVSPTAVENAISGWDFNTISSQSQANHYVFNLAPVGPGSSYTLSTTLVWNVGLTDYGSLSQPLSNLELELLGPNGVLIGSSVSVVDNVQMLYLQNLSAGSYDLVVSGNMNGKFLSSTDYALAYNFKDPGGSNVPEPASLALLATGILLPLLKRYRRIACR